MTGRETRRGVGILNAVHRAARKLGMQPFESRRYTQTPGWLTLWGVGAPDRGAARQAHVESGHSAILWDLGYVGRYRPNAYVRVSIDHDHPWRLLDRTPPAPERWDVHGIELRDDHDPNGHIVMVGLGNKSRVVGTADLWEAETAERLRQRFPKRRIVYRPKPKSEARPCGFEVDERPLIEDVLRGAALVVCKHSNVAVDAAIAGVPFECDDGAAYWLKGKDFTPFNRLDFLRRLAWWQWREDEAEEAMQFIRRVSEA